MFIEIKNFFRLFFVKFLWFENDFKFLKVIFFFSSECLVIFKMFYRGGGWGEFGLCF